MLDEEVEKHRASLVWRCVEKNTIIVGGGGGKAEGAAVQSKRTVLTVHLFSLQTI